MLMLEFLAALAFLANFLQDFKAGDYVWAIIPLTCAIIIFLDIIWQIASMKKSFLFSSHA